MKFKTKLQDPVGKQRNKVTEFIAQNKSRQEFVPPLGKDVDLLKAEPLHNTSNAWQSWFLTALTIVMHNINQNHLKPATAVFDLPDSSPPACISEVPQRHSQVWETAQGLSAVVQ